MRMYISLSMLIIVFCLASILVAIPSVDDFSLHNPLWNGLSRLREEYGFEYASLSSIDLLPENAVLFIFPSKPIDGLQAEALMRFINGGGVAVFLDEYGYSNPILNPLGLNITSSLLRDPLYKWRSSELPYAWVEFNGKTFKICLNYASTIQLGGFRALGFSSYFSFLDEDLDGIHDASEPSGRMCIAASKTFGRGVIIVFSDSSIFLNSMLSIADNRALLEELCRSRKPYVLKDLLHFGIYTMLRESFISALYTLYSLMFNSSISYPIIFLTVLAVFSASGRLYSRFGRRLKPMDLRVRLYSTVRLHPGWSREVLEEILPEVFEGEGGR